MNVHIFVIFILVCGPSTVLAKSWSDMYLGISVGDLTRNYESQQLQQAQDAQLISDSYNFSIDRGFVYAPKPSWMQHLRFRVDSYSTLEIGQHGSAVDIEKITFYPNQFGSIGISGLYNQIANFSFVQANLGIQRQLGSYHVSAMLNLPMKRTHTFESNLSQNLYQIAAGNRGANLSAAQKKQIVETLLNQPIASSSEIDTIYDAITSLQAVTPTNQTANYTSIFQQYSDQTASLYYDDLVTANKAGVYDLIAQYGIHAKIAKHDILQNSVFTSAAYAALSVYEKQSIVNLGVDVMDLTGSYKTLSPQCQIVYQDSRLRLRGALSVRWYIDRSSADQVYFPHEFSVAQQHVNFATDTFRATNIS